MRRRLVPLLVLTAATVGTLFVGPAHADIDAIATTLAGDAEVPGPGDEDGFGTAIVILDSDAGEVCVRFRIREIAPAAAAHIHVGGPEVAGPVVVTLPTPMRGRSSGCVGASTDLIQRIIDNPGDFYVNVHNARFPGGAVRGQLG